MIIHEDPPKGRVVKGDKEDPGQAALEYAEQGIPVFPCKLDKSPAIRKCWEAKKKGLTGEKLAAHARTCPHDGHGFHDATTDPSKIREWWTRYPEAMIGSPAGKHTSWFVLDVDVRPDGGIDGWAELAELEHQNGKLPDTMSVRTPSGGGHIYLQDFEGVGNSSGSLPEGLDIRGGGKGYTIIPPSQGYEVINHSPVAEAPAWLLKLIKTKPQIDVRTQPAHTPRPEASIDLDGPPIPFGRRNITLTSIAGMLHDGTRDFGELLAAIEEINRYRCVPPIGEHPEDNEPNETTKITRSIYGRPPSRPSAPPVEPQMLEELRCIELTHLWGQEWRGQNWLSARSIFATLILASREYGRLIPAGVRLSMSYRDVALAARVTLQTAYNSVQLLRQAHLVRKDDYERSPEDAGAFVLVSPDEATRATLEHSPTRVVCKLPGMSVLTLRTPRLRVTTPGTGKRLRGTVTCTRKVRETPALRQRETILRYSKKTEYMLDVLDFHGGEMPLRDLAQVVGGRSRELRSRILEGLENDRVLRLEGEKVFLQEGWIERLYDVLEVTGEEEIVELTRELYAKQRENRWSEKPEEPEVPQEDESKPGPGLICSEAEVFRLARELFGTPNDKGNPLGEGVLGSRTRLAVSLSLEPADLDVLDAIAEFEERFGSGSFTWNRAGAKELFYQSSSGYWPGSEQLERLRAYTESVGANLSSPVLMKASA